jgi:TolB protein
MLLSTMADGSIADRPDILFQNQYDRIGVVEGGPHYSLWSPDGKKLASIVGTLSGLVLALFDTEDESFLTLPLRAPMYFGWSPNSERFAVHGSRKLQIIDDLIDGEFGLELEGGSSRYFAPQFAPDGEGIAFVTEDDGKFFLNVHQFSNKTDTPVASFEGFVWFRWSPDGESLAVLKGDSQSAESEIWLVAANGRSKMLLVRGRYQMFMWSPDGEKLLLSEVDKLQPFRAHWTVIDANAGVITQLATFTPTLSLQQMILFFDQYSASHTFWSPDGQSIVFAGVLHTPISDEGPSARSIERIWVVDVDGDTLQTAPSRSDPLSSDQLANRVTTGTSLLLPGVLLALVGALFE